MQNPDFWKNNEEASRSSQKVAELKEELLNTELLKKELQDLKELSSFEASSSQAIPGSEEDLKKAYNQIKEKIEKKKFKIFLSGKYDKKNALLEIFSGAGGQDAQDWVTMLLRMYERYCIKKGFKIQVLHQSFGDPGGPDGRIGTKSATMEIRGNYAYGFLKKEAGVHRLVRISPFSSQKLRHTSFALVDVMPEINQDESEIEIKPEDIKLETFKSSGPGGQYVNKTESAVRITHLPTGITVSCQTERMQGKNREHAMKILYAKLHQLKTEKHQKELKEIKAAQTDSGRASPAGGGSMASWGNQIRSYVLHPYKMVKDLRTQAETSDTEKVLDGDLDSFINEELKINTND